MISTLAISGYRSFRDLLLPLDRLNTVTGANGSGKASLYRALRLLGDAALNSVVSSLAKRLLSPKRAAELTRRLSEGESKAALKREFGVDRTTVYRYIGRAKVTGRGGVGK